MTDLATTTAAERVQRARSELIMARRFYGVLVSNVEPVITRKHKTAATNGKQHFWNPNYVATLAQEQLLFVQAHESEHDARHHSTRRGGRDPEGWNEATDYAINIDLVDEGFVPPPNVLLDAKYRGWAAEDIYRARELDRQQQQQPQPQDGDESDDDEQSSGGDDASDDDQNDLATLATSRATRATPTMVTTTRAMVLAAMPAMATTRTVTLTAATPVATRATSPTLTAATVPATRARALAMPAARPTKTATASPAARRLSATSAVAAKCSTRPTSRVISPSKTPSGSGSRGRPHRWRKRSGSCPATSRARSSGRIIRRKIGARRCGLGSTTVRFAPRRGAGPIVAISAAA